MDELIAESRDLVKLEPFVQNRLKGSKVLVLVKHPGTPISAIEGMVKSACFVGTTWSWHRDVPSMAAKTGVYQRPQSKQRGLTLCRCAFSGFSRSNYVVSL